MRNHKEHTSYRFWLKGCKAIGYSKGGAPLPDVWKSWVPPCCFSMPYCKGLWNVCEFWKDFSVWTLSKNQEGKKYKSIKTASYLCLGNLNKVFTYKTVRWATSMQNQVWINCFESPVTLESLALNGAFLWESLHQRCVWMRMSVHPLMVWILLLLIRSHKKILFGS